MLFLFNGPVQWTYMIICTVIFLCGESYSFFFFLLVLNIHCFCKSLFTGLFIWLDLVLTLVGVLWTKIILEDRFTYKKKSDSGNSCKISSLSSDIGSPNDN